MSTPAGGPSAQPPRRVDGRYTILNRLGKGSMGVVYRAHDDQMDRDVALKLMMTDAEGDEIAVERFQREARAMGRLLHRNIVTVFNMGDEAGRYYIVMELLEGCTLSEWMKIGSHTIEEKVDLMLQACDGLAVAHSAGIIHRDVKPNNLFVQADGTLKIVDFGIARLATSSMTRSGLILGTPHYMSPEQARGAEVDGRSDVFSAAAVFYLMLSGRKPFDGADLPIVLHRVVHDDPPPLTEAEAPAALARVILKGLKKAPEQRHQTVVEFVADLARFKRQFDGETRRIMTTAEGGFDTLRRTVEAIEAMRTTLGVSGSSALPASVASLTTRVPRLGTARAGSVPVNASGRDEALGVAAAVSEVTRVADEELAQLTALHDGLASAELALGAGDARRALEMLRTGGSYLSGATCRQFDSLWARAQKRLDEQQAEAAMAAESMAAARARDEAERLAADKARAAAVRRGQAAAFARKAIEALACGRYPDAEAEARRAVALDAERADAASVLIDAPRLALEERAEAERRAADIQRARDVDRLVREVRLHLRSGDYARAALAAEKANELEPSRADVSLACSHSRAVIAALRAGSPDAAIVVEPLERSETRSPSALEARAGWSLVQRYAEDAQAAGRRLGWQVFRALARGRRA